MPKWMKFAFKLTKKAKHPQHLMGAVVVKGNSVLGQGYNIASKWAMGHCERMALKGYRDYSGATIYIARANGGCSKPCDDCFDLIKSRGLSKIIYLGWDGGIIEERL